MEIKIKENKTTEFGLIPSDWQIKEFQDVMTGFFSGATPYRGRPEYYKGQINWITSGELNYNIITDTNEKITEEAVRNTNLKILPKGTFLFAITGLEAEGTRGSCAITGIDATTNQSCMALFPFESLDVKYLYHYYVWKGKMLALRYCQGTKQQSYTGKIARKLPIIIPPTKSEQTAIATALSDTDALIENLEKLIAKKRNIKQGVMQELLKPESNWILTSVGEVATIRKGEQLNKDTLTAQGQYPVMNGGIQPSGYTDKWNQNPNTIIISEGGNSCGYVNFIKTRFWQGGHCYSVDAKIHKHFLYHLLKFHEKEIMGLRVGSGLPNIQRNRLIEFSLSIPDREKQHAIALVLDEINEVITAMENKLQKYKMVKQGMMQALLTGKIRLA